jgi:hypothetical protein
MTIKLKTNGVGAGSPATPSQLTAIKNDLGIPADITNAIAANTALGALAGPVQTLIDNSVQNKVDKSSSILNLDVTPLTSTLNASSFIDPTTGLTITAALQAIRAAITALGSGATPPTITTDPTVSFPGGTGDVGETFTITPGTVAGGANTGTQYQVVVDGVPQGTLFAETTGTLQASWFTGTRLFRIVQNVTWTGGAAVQRSSVTYTLNSTPAVPVITTPPSWGAGTPQVGTVYAVNAGTATNTPTSIALNIYRGYASLSNLGTLVTTLTATGTYTIVAADAGTPMAIVEVATNAAGASAPVASSIIVIAASGGAPQWIDSSGNTVAGATLPGFTNNLYAAGDTITINLGTTVGNVNPTGYNIQYLRDNLATGMPSASGVANLSYLVTSSDNGHTISATITASNSGGISNIVTIAGVPISGTSGGGGGSGGVLSGSINTLADNTTGTPYVLSTIGTTDWAAYINGSIATPDKKSGGPGAITATVSSGAGASGAASHNIQFLSWTGGTPNATGNGDGDYHISGVGGEMTFTITGVGTTTQNLSIWFEVIGVSDVVSVVASLSDGSATNYTYSGTPAYNVRVDLSFKAGSAGQTLTVKINNTTGSNNIGYQGVALY